MRRRRLPYHFDRTQLVRLFDVIDNPTVMMASLLAAFCGLRLGEVVGLRRDHINLETMQARVVDAKNTRRVEEGYGKDRHVAIPTTLRQPIELWLELIGDEQYLFPTIAEDRPHLHEKYLFRRYKEALQRAGLLQFDYAIANGNKRCKYNFHTLRHTYATMLLEHTGNLDLVRKALGHTSISTTLIYTHMTDRHLTEKVNEAFGNASPARAQGASIGSDDPLQVARLRLARGEITIAEFSELRDALGS